LRMSGGYPAAISGGRRSDRGRGFGTEVASIHVFGVDV
jgi:hypothetical protein